MNEPMMQYRGTVNVFGDVWMTTYDRIVTDPLGDMHNLNECSYHSSSSIPDSTDLEFYIRAPSHQMSDDLTKRGRRFAF